jgi:hypothetical protein
VLVVVCGLFVFSCVSLEGGLELMIINVELYGNAFGRFETFSRARNLVQLFLPRRVEVLLVNRSLLLGLLITMQCKCM